MKKGTKPAPRRVHPTANLRENLGIVFGNGRPMAVGRISCSIRARLKAICSMRAMAAHRSPPFTSAPPTRTETEMKKFGPPAVAIAHHGQLVRFRGYR